MGIYINKESKVIIQGITGQVGASFAKRMLDYQTPIVAGVTPGKGGHKVEGIPVYNTVLEAVEKMKADTSLVCVNPRFVKSAVLEAINSGIKNIIIYAEGVPSQDSIEIVQIAKSSDVNIFGPNSAGVVTVDEVNVSDIHDSILVKGNIGIVSRSGTLTYEVIEQLKKSKQGVSTVVCLGGDPIVGVSQVEVLRKFDLDPETEKVIYIGEIGGTEEVEVSKFISQMKKPVFSYIAGLHAPEGKRMGHAGAIISNELEKAKSKQNIMKEGGAVIVNYITDFDMIFRD